MKINKKTILVVDDNSSNIDILIGLLDEYDVIASLDGSSSLNILQQENVDLILLDIMMPVMDGFEVCKQLKKDPRTSKIPIMFLSAKDQINDIKKGFELGAVDYITKPFNPIELLSRIQTHLRLREYEQNLEEKVQEQLEQNRIQEQILFQKSKQAEMGEMLMHISHQWKQPLSEIGSINTLNLAKIDLDIELNKEELKTNFLKTADILAFMSNTVDTFRFFYLPNQEDKLFEVSKSIDLVLKILNATFDYNNIKIDVTYKQDAKIFANINEFSQVILAILNNAKEIFILRNIDQRHISIKVDQKDEKLLLDIEDNAGGIRLKNSEEIFLPYVSSKNSLGIGLYMAKTIINKYGGDINVSNTSNGALFKIKI